ncbi:MAG TPA: hypothetical protein DCL73_04325 [Treponema sp.]|nr:hypothetical protein [Treponema sp.]
MFINTGKYFIRNSLRNILFVPAYTEKQPAEQKKSAVRICAGSFAANRPILASRSTADFFCVSGLFFDTK